MQACRFPRALDPYLFTGLSSLHPYPGEGSVSVGGTQLCEEVHILQTSECILISSAVEAQMSGFVCSHETGPLNGKAFANWGFIRAASPTVLHTVIGDDADCGISESCHLQSPRPLLS